MKFSLKSLNAFLNQDYNQKEISDSLFQLGHEHEIEDNNIIDVEFTPNKGDCLSVYGLSRDIGSILDTKKDLELYDKKIDKFNLNFKNLEPNFCRKISFLKISVSEINSSYKEYLNSYFNDLNVGKNNFFTDISNYVSYEIGQPTHCYDYKYVKEGFSLEKLKNETEFNTLIGETVKLQDGEIVFKTEEDIINFAGIMGSEKSKCSSSTKEVLVECASFNPDMIIGKTVKYDLKSEAAYKFERYVDEELHDKAIRRFIKIVQDHCEIKDLSIATFDYRDCIEHKKIKKDFDKINAILGTKLSHSTIEDILSKLGFEIDDFITVPSWRRDVSTMNDLAEEVARVIGYDNIDSTPFISLDNKSDKQYIKSKINSLRSIMKNMGFSEVINDPFEEIILNNSIKIDNPIDSTRKVLRSSIIPSLINNLDFNEKRQKDSIKLFEISDIYYIDKNYNHAKKTVLGIIISGRISNNPLNFNVKFDNNYLQNLFENSGVNLSQSLFEIPREHIKSKIKSKIFAAEIEVQEIDDEFISFNLKSDPIHKFKNYTQVSEFPSINRDVSISLLNEDLLENLLEKVFSIKIIDLKETLIFDFYQNPKLSIIKIGFKFIFQSKTQTLTDKMVDIEMNKVFNEIMKLDGVEIPGLKL